VTVLYFTLTIFVKNDGLPIQPHQKDQNGQENEIETEITFGGYAPTVTSAPKRKRKILLSFFFT